jgi:hypothetical protein
LRRLRIAEPAQLRLDIADCVSSPLERWWTLPQNAQEMVVRLLARMIEASVVLLDAEEAVER